MEKSRNGQGQFRHSDPPPAESPGEVGLKELAELLGLEYEIDCSIASDASLASVSGWVKFKSPSAKRYVVVSYASFGTVNHTKCVSAAVTVDRAVSSSWPVTVRMARNMVASGAVRFMMRGCSLKVSKHRKVELPPSAFLEELLLKLSISGGCS